jgi:hypothetical protein
MKSDLLPQADDGRNVSVERGEGTVEGHEQRAPEAPAEPKGKPFERLVAAVQKKLEPGSTVEWDVRRRAKSKALRQFDVLVQGTLGSARLVVAIEAKDRSKLITIGMVGDFHTALTGIGANKGIMVSSVGFTGEALLEAAERRIDTYVLRPARDEDWENYLRRIEVHLTMKSMLYEEAEIELADGTKQYPNPGGMWPINSPNGKMVFFDEVIDTAMRAKPEWKAGERRRVTLVPGHTFGDDKIGVVSLQCRPQWVDGPRLDRILLESPEDWGFFKMLPGETIEEKYFFEFAELQGLADRFKQERAQRKRRKKAK